MQGNTDRELLRLNMQNPFLPLVRHKRENRRRRKHEAESQGVGATEVNPETRSEESIVNDCMYVDQKNDRIAVVVRLLLLLFNRIETKKSSTDAEASGSELSTKCQQCFRD
jgi:hypothetical protein